MCLVPQAASSSGQTFRPCVPLAISGGLTRSDDADLRQFVRINNLDELCETRLRELNSRQLAYVMGTDGGVHGTGRNDLKLADSVRCPVAVVLSRVKKSRQEQRGR